MAKIKIFEDICKGCLLCANACRFGVLVKSQVRGKQGYLLPEVVNADNCKACHMCEMTCPDMAIEIFEN